VGVWNGDWVAQVSFASRRITGAFAGAVASSRRRRLMMTESQSYDAIERLIGLTDPKSVTYTPLLLAAILPRHPVMTRS